MSSARQGWTSGPDGRGTQNLIWSCLSTLFICVWATLHPNVPSRHDTQLAIFLRKLKWTAVTALAPEMVTTCAFMQWLSARRFARRMAEAGFPEYNETHGFYANMGGIVVMRTRCDSKAAWEVSPLTPTPYQCRCYTGPIDATGLSALVDKGMIPKSIDLSIKAINDKSKADWFVKGLACAQALWSALQCVGRTAQRLPLSTLELTTLAFVATAVVNYVFWWNKPMDVSVPTEIVLCCSCCDDGGGGGDAGTGALKRGEQQLFGQRQAFESGPTNKPAVSGSASDTLRSQSRVPNDCFDGDVRMEQLVLTVMVFCLPFGGIHCGAWNFSFPTPHEQVLWRVASVLSTFLMLTGFIVTAVLEWVGVTRLWSAEFPRRGRSGRSKFEADEKAKAGLPTRGGGEGMGRVLNVVVNASIWIPYVFARTYLIIEAFSSLRSLPAGSYETVNWIRLIPHVG